MIFNHDSNRFISPVRLVFRSWCRERALPAIVMLFEKEDGRNTYACIVFNFNCSAILKHEENSSQHKPFPVVAKLHSPTIQVYAVDTFAVPRNLELLSSRTPTG